MGELKKGPPPERNRREDVQVVNTEGSEMGSKVDRRTRSPEARRWADGRHASYERASTRRDEKPRVQRFGREALGGEDGRCARLVCIVAPVPRAHLRVPIPPLPVHTHGANHVALQICDRLRAPGLKILGGIDPHCQQPIQSALPPTNLDPAMYRMPHARCADAAVPPSSVHVLSRFPSPAAHDTRQALQAAGSTRRTLHLRPSSIDISEKYHLVDADVVCLLLRRTDTCAPFARLLSPVRLSGRLPVASTAPTQRPHFLLFISFSPGLRVAQSHSPIRTPVAPCPHSTIRSEM
ncbi:hypothetical protein B0H13DRAFT_1083927 [Mycena leptocephala]|nr:hypothetical protein B0H13DRAFT_1083927 [Mycena leptocephala]